MSDDGPVFLKHVTEFTQKCGNNLRNYIEYQILLCACVCNFFYLQQHISFPDWTPTTFRVSSWRSLRSCEETLSIRNRRQSNPQIPFNKLKHQHLYGFNFRIQPATCWIRTTCQFKNNFIWVWWRAMICCGGMLFHNILCQGRLDVFRGVNWHNNCAFWSSIQMLVYTQHRHDVFIIHWWTVKICFLKTGFM